MLKKQERKQCYPSLSQHLSNTDNIPKHIVPVVILVIPAGITRGNEFISWYLKSLMLSDRPELSLGRGIYTIETFSEIPFGMKLVLRFVSCSLFRFTRTYEYF